MLLHFGGFWKPVFIMWQSFFADSLTLVSVFSAVAIRVATSGSQAFRDATSCLGSIRNSLPFSKGYTRMRWRTNWRWQKTNNMNKEIHSKYISVMVKVWCQHCSGENFDDDCHCDRQMLYRDSPQWLWFLNLHSSISGHLGVAINKL